MHGNVGSLSIVKAINVFFPLNLTLSLKKRCQVTSLQVFTNEGFRLQTRARWRKVIEE